MSALAPLVLSEPQTNRVTTWVSEDPSIALWGITRVELASAIERRAREGSLSAGQRRVALRRVKRLCDSAHEVTDLFTVRSLAATLLARHSLRTADALQLAAALVVAEGNPGGALTFVVLDRRLAEAADREGLEVLSWPPM